MPSNLQQRIIDMVPDLDDIIYPERGMTIRTMANRLGVDTRTAYNTGVLQVKDMILYDAEGNRKYWCRAQPGNSNRHYYFWTLDVETSRTYGWLRDSDNRTRAKTTKFIKENTLEIGGLGRDAVSLSLAEATFEIARISKMMSSTVRPVMADEMERALLPITGILRTQAKMYADLME